MVMVRLRVSLQGMNVSQCNVLKSDGNKRVCVHVHMYVYFSLFLFDSCEVTLIQSEINTTV